MMKKMMLGVLALTQVVSLASGYVKTDSSIGLNKDLELKIKPNIDLGVYFGQNKEGYIFGGGELEALLKLKEEQMIDSQTNNAFGKAAKKANYYLGTRFDAKLTDDARLKMLFLYDTTNKNNENKPEKGKVSVINHLKELKQWDGKDETLYLNGYKIFDKENNFLASAILNGKYDETIDYTLGAIYGSDNFKNNTLETFLKASSKFDKYDVSANITSVLGNYKRMSLERDSYFEMIKDGIVISENLANGGKLAADLTISSDKLVKGLNLKAKAFTDLDTVLVEYRQLIKSGLETEAKYVKDNVELKGQLNYRNELNNLNKSEPGDESFKEEDKLKDDFIKLVHRPEIVLGVKYNKDGLLIETENANEVFVAHEIGKGLNYVSNKLTTLNKLEKEVANGVTLGLIGNYKVGFSQLNEISKLKFENRLVVGPHLNVKIEKEGSSFTSNNKLRYGLNIDKELINTRTLKDRQHEIVLISDTKASYKVGDFTIKPSLDLVNVLRFDKKYNQVEIVYGMNKSKLVLDQFKGKKVIPNEFIMLGYTDAALALDVLYEKDRLSVEGKVKDNVVVAYLYDRPQNGMAAQQDVMVVNRVKLNGEVGYKAIDNVKFAAGVGFGHDFTNSIRDGEGVELTSAKTQAKIKKDIKKYDDVKEDTLTSKFHKHIKKTENGDRFIKHKFEVNPYVKTELNFFDAKLSIVPKLEAKIKATQDMLTEAEGIGSLKVEYKW